MYIFIFIAKYKDSSITIQLCKLYIIRIIASLIRFDYRYILHSYSSFYSINFLGILIALRYTWSWSFSIYICGHALSILVAICMFQGLSARNPDSCVNNHGAVVGCPGVGGKCSPLAREGKVQLLSRIYSSPESIPTLVSLSLYLFIFRLPSSPERGKVAHRVTIASRSHGPPRSTCERGIKQINDRVTIYVVVRFSTTAIRTICAIGTLHVHIHTQALVSRSTFLD